VGASTSHNPMGLHGLLQGELYLITSSYNLNFKISNSNIKNLTMEIFVPPYMGYRS
jgi:hypothetical protein